MIDKGRNDLRLNKKCFNCGKKGHYTKDCCSSTSNKKKLVAEESTEEGKYTSWKRNQAKAFTARLIPTINDSDADFYLVGWAFMTQKADSKGKWYLDSYASRYIYNSYERFSSNLQIKTCEYFMANRNIITSTQVIIIILPLKNRLELILFNVIYAPECDSNLISLS